MGYGEDADNDGEFEQIDVYELDLSGYGDTILVAVDRHVWSISRPQSSNIVLPETQRFALKIERL